MTRLRPAHWLFFSGLAVLAASLTAPRVVPLYDGVGFPDQPYQFAGRPGASPQPSPVSSAVPKPNLAGLYTTLTSHESGPQMRVTFAPAAVNLPAAATQLMLVAAPLAPGAQPSSGTIASNVYRIIGTSQPGPPTVKQNGGQVFLRLPQGVTFKTAPAMVYRSPGGQWKQLTTYQSGADIYVAYFSGWGDYALAINATSPEKSGTSSPLQHYGPLLAVVVLVIAGIVGIIRFKAPGKHEPPAKT